MSICVSVKSSRKIYIAGKITGLRNHKLFFDSAENMLLQDDNITTINPSVLKPGFEQEEYLHICFAMIDCCNEVFFLKSWKDSKGAKQEMPYAIQKNKTLIFLNVSDALLSLSDLESICIAGEC